MYGIDVEPDELVIIDRATAATSTVGSTGFPAVQGLAFNSSGALFGVDAFRKAGTTVNPLTPETSSTLVVSGIFRRTRNPMYLALLLVLIAWGIYLANLYALVITTGFILYMTCFQIKPEERALEKSFGAEFIDYKETVRRWI